MRKNKMMRLASALLVAVLLTTCAISGTFAKYVTEVEVSDQARVAYWGFVEPTTVEFKLFEHGDGNVIATVGDDDLIAPGTSASANLVLGYTANGTIAAPEVAYSYEVDAVATGSYAALDANENFFWTLTAKGSTTKYQKVDDLVAALKALSQPTVAKNTLPDINGGITIGWEWTFTTDDAHDEADTLMGNAGSLDNIKLVITITATQLD
jgi:hypothetical protein